MKARLNSIVGALSEEGSVVITKNGRPCAVLMPVNEDTDLEVIWSMYDRVCETAERGGWIALDAKDVATPRRKRRPIAAARVTPVRRRGSQPKQGS